MIHNSRQKGAAALPAILSIALLILVVGIGLTALGFSEALISAGQNKSSKALYYAEAGARDALMRVARNKNYNCPTTDCYSIAFEANGCADNDNSACARVSVSSGSGAGGSPKIIISKGQTSSNIRKIQIDVYFDSPSLNGEIATTTWKEIIE